MLFLLVAVRRKAGARTGELARSGAGWSPEVYGAHSRSGLALQTARCAVGQEAGRCTVLPSGLSVTLDIRTALGHFAVYLQRVIVMGGLRGNRRPRLRRE
jgi:hypothetical protein